MLFNGKYYNKPGHLGMTRQQLKDALAGGGGGGGIPDTLFVKITYDPDTETYSSNMTYEEIAAAPYGTHFIVLTETLTYINASIDGSSAGYPFRGWTQQYQGVDQAHPTLWRVEIDDQNGISETVIST